MMLFNFALAAALLAISTTNDNMPTVVVSAVPSKFTPSKITLHRGVATAIKFAHTEGAHAIESSELGIPRTTLLPGQDATVIVDAKQPGTYVLHCEVFCGEDHENMTLTVVVEQ